MDPLVKSGVPLDPPPPAPAVALSSPLAFPTTETVSRISSFSPVVCLPYRLWERFFFVGTPAEACPVLEIGVPTMPFSIGSGDERVVEWIIQGAAGGQVVINRGYLRCQNGAAIAFSSDEIILALRARFRSQIIPELNSGYQVRFYIIKQVLSSVFTGTRWSFTYDKQNLLAGTSTDQGGAVGSMLPVFCAVTCQLRGDDLGRSRRGSKRWGPIQETDTVDDQGNFLKTFNLIAWQLAMEGFYPHMDMTDPVNKCKHSIASPLLLAGRDGQLPSIMEDWNTFPEIRTVNKRLGSQISRKTKTETA